jgi:CubicO group peptidase (beta-lactamase class C family)
LLVALLLVLLLSISACGVRHTAQATADAAAELDRHAAAEIARAGLPGGTLAVLRDGELVHLTAFGHADVDTAVALRAEVPMRIASVSKPLTAIAVLRLVEQGRLELHTPVVPRLRARLPSDFQPHPQFDRLTVQHLLSHCGGWDRRSDFDPILQARYMAGLLGTDAPPSTTALVAWALSRPPDFHPGIRCVYSNLGYAVLGRLLEAETGLGYEAAVRQLVLEPAGLAHLQLAATLPAARLPEEPRYHDPRHAVSVFDPSTEVPLPDGGIVLEPMDASGGWLASAADLVELVAALEGHRRPPLLGAELRQAMLTPVVMHDGDLYGLGWDTVRRGLSYWHTGDLPGSAAFLVREADGTVWALLANGTIRSARAGQRLRQRLGRAVRVHAARSQGSRGALEQVPDVKP